MYRLCKFSSDETINRRPRVYTHAVRSHTHIKDPVDKLAKQGAMKNMSEVSSNNLLLSSHEINSLLKKTVYKQIEKGKFAIPSCSRYLARVTFEFMEH